MLAPWKQSYNQTRQHIKKQKYQYFVDKGLCSQSYGFATTHVWMWELDNKEGGTPKNWYIQIVMLKTLEIPLDSNEIKQLSPKGNQLWMFTERLKLKLQSIGHLMWKADSLEKTDAGKHLVQEEKGTTEDEMVEWYHQFNGHEFE